MADHARDAVDVAAASRPREIEQWSNLHIVHPLSRHLARACVRFGIVPNAVSVAGIAFAVAAAFAFYFKPWPTGAIVGFACLVATHVIDGADGLVARATGRTSLGGAAIDGICDAVTLGGTYVALGLLVFERFGVAAIPLVLVAFVSNVVHANAFEGRRGTYMKWVYGKEFGAKPGADPRGGPPGFFRAPLEWAYLHYYSLAGYEAGRVVELMRDLTEAGGETARRARGMYAVARAPLVRRFSLLGQNHKTVAIGAAMLAAHPEAFFVYVATVVNLLLVPLVLMQRRQDRALVAALERLRDTSA